MWTKCLVLLDTEATPKLIFTGQLRKICVRAKPPKKGNTVTSEDHVNCKGVLKDVPLRFDNVNIIIEFVAVEGVPVTLLI